MGPASSPRHDPALAEPTSYAEMMITLGPAQQWGTDKGTIPCSPAHHLVTTLGILGSAVTGTGGAVLTLRASPGLTALAFAELALALAAAVLITVCSHTRATHKSKGRKISRPPPRPAGKRPR